MPNRRLRVPALPNQVPTAPGLPIHDAAYAGDVDALQRELASGVDPNVVDPRGRTPLICLCGAASDSGDDDASMAIFSRAGTGQSTRARNICFVGPAGAPSCLQRVL